MDQKEYFSDEIIDAILRSFYVDDLLRSLLDEIGAINLIRNLEKLLANRGFNLTKFNSNSESVLKAVPPEKRATTSSLEFENSITRALGVKWDLQEDNFMYTVDSNLNSDTCTKGQILKKTSTVFDPLGFLTPFTLVAKIIIQDLWRKNVGWDEEVDESIQNAWKTWMQELSKITRPSEFHEASISNPLTRSNPTFSVMHPSKHSEPSLIYAFRPLPTLVVTWSWPNQESLQLNL